MKTTERYFFRLDPRTYKLLMNKVKEKNYKQRQNQLGLYLGEIAQENIIILPKGHTWNIKIEEK